MAAAGDMSGRKQRARIVQYLRVGATSVSDLSMHSEGYVRVSRACAG